MNILSYFTGIDPAAAIVQNGKVVAYIEEERLIRIKHAPNMFPARAVQSCLQLSGLTLAEIDAIVYGWDAPRYGGGDIAAFYDQINRCYPPDDGTRRWQRHCIEILSPASLRRSLELNLGSALGIRPQEIPPLQFYPHHRTHAAAAFYLSPYEEALIVTIDGSGDSDCTTIWRGKGVHLEPLYRIEIPHSLGWFYAAMTEYLGFRAYDGEYKVMGLAAYGREHLHYRAKLRQVVRTGPNGWDYEIDPRYIHHGPHSFSERFTDHLVELLGLRPRQGRQPLESHHEDLAYEVQNLLEETVLRLLAHWAAVTGLKTLCIGGGVGLNVKMNSRIYREGLFDYIFPFPVPNDSGLAIGAATGIWTERVGRRPEPIDHVYWGPWYTDESIELQLQACGVRYSKCDDITEAAADLLADGKVIGWFQGRLEGGPRALGGRSILADPRTVKMRDRVNAAVKFREYWRPFCPSLTEESAWRYLKKPCRAPFMILAFEATDEAKQTVPAVVHVDGTMRAQTVTEAVNPRYHRLLHAFEKRTGVPCLLNTSFNIKGEAIVCTPRDALRTFWSTGLDALAIGACLVEKTAAPLSMEPDDAVR